MSAANNAKKTIYIDVDEEITGIIDKVRTTNESIIALVLPKRAAMLQSAVNMKLLKRSADQSDKRVVLITSEPSLLPLAGAAGIHVAPNLQSRPYLPGAPGSDAAKSQVSDEPAEPDVPIGGLPDTPDKADKQAEPIEIDNTPKPDPAAAAGGAAKKAKKPKKDKSKKIPNFNKFRILLAAGIALLVLLIGGGYYALAVAPNATVTLRTESSEVQADAAFQADTEENDLDLEERILPAKTEEIKKTETEKVAASGQRDDGTKASGTINLRNCTDNAVNIPAGTGISNGSNTFITQNAVRLDQGQFSSPSSGSQCRNNGDHTGSVRVTAQQNGDQYNLSPRSYTVSGNSGVIANGEQMSGGTSKITKIVAQADIDTAKKRITDRQNSVVEQVKQQLESDNYVGFVDSFSIGNPTFNASPAVGAEAPETTISAEVTYTMLGVRESDLRRVIEEQSKDKVDTSRQSILSYGLDDAAFEVGRKTGSATSISVTTTLVAGPEINQDELKQLIGGKGKDESSSSLRDRPGITDVRVDTKPFWVSNVPKNPSKITFVVEQANGERINN